MPTFVVVPPETNKPLYKLKVADDVVQAYDQVRKELGGGWLEALYHTGHDFMGMYIDEEGKLKHFDKNPRATLLLEGCLRHGDYISGIAILFGLGPGGVEIDCPMTIAEIEATISQ